VTARRKRPTPAGAHAALEAAGQLTLPLEPKGERRLGIDDLAAMHQELATGSVTGRDR
jgi:hypothetical protein